MCAVNEQVRNFDKTGIKGDGRTPAELCFEECLKVSIEHHTLQTRAGVHH